MIWLIDYTHYTRPIAPALKACKDDYFKIKRYKRFKLIGETAPVKTRVFSMGLLRLATLLSRAGVETKFLHYYQLETFLSSGEDLPETVAFSCVTPTVPACAAFAERIKKQSPKTRVYLGGAHVNLAQEETQKRYPVFDKIIAAYELDAASAIADKPLADNGGAYVDFSLLPYPLQEYAVNTFTAMGCPFRCHYCADGRSPRFQASNDGLLSEMMSLLPRRNLVHFFDSVLGYDRAGIKRACEDIAATGHDFVLSCDMRADLLTADLCGALNKAGFKEVRLGVESSDADLLERNGRTLSFLKFKEQLKMIRERFDGYITLYSVTGLPGTTKDSQKRTLDNFGQLLTGGLADEIKNALYVPYPMQGVDYAARGVEVLSDDWSRYDRQSYPVYRLQTLTDEEIWELYLLTARTINERWLSSVGYSSFDELPSVEGYYNEYIETNYVGKGGK